MKKAYKKPTIEVFPTKCHISTLSPDEPEEMDRSRRSLLKGVGLMTTVGSITLLHASCVDVQPPIGECDPNDQGPP